MRVLWHVSEDPSIERFEPRSNPGHDSPEPLVWAIDDEHVPAYWFPREMPRGTFWAVDSTTDEDVERFLGGDRGRRIHVIEPARLDELRAATVFAYRLPPETFERYERAAGYYVSREPVVPAEIVRLDDLVGRHAEAGIELRPDDGFAELWQQVAASTLEFSGIRLRNLGRPPRSGRTPASPAPAAGDLSPSTSPLRPAAWGTETLRRPPASPDERA